MIDYEMFAAVIGGVLGDAVSDFGKAMVKTWRILSPMLVLTKKTKIQQRHEREIAQQFNIGKRHKKVSIKRPSPQLSRRKYESLQTQVRINSIER